MSRQNNDFLFQAEEGEVYIYHKGPDGKVSLAHLATKLSLRLS
jgi:hypothetical protein